MLWLNRKKEIRPILFEGKCVTNSGGDVGLSDGQAEEEQGVGGHLLEEHHGFGAFHNFLAQIKVGNS